MSLTKSKGNMYDWVTHCHSHLAGECPHQCSYCYVQALERRWKTGRYAGPVRLVEDELKVKYGTGRTIFIEHMHDLFAADVPDEFIIRVMAHCKEWPDNTYVFQTKNPEKMGLCLFLPAKSVVGVTLESDFHHQCMGKAPDWQDRAFFAGKVFAGARERGWRSFLTVEPVLQFGAFFADSIAEMRPDWVNIGADSKGHGLPEPTGDELRQLIRRLTELGVTIRQKTNLKRLLCE